MEEWKKASSFQNCQGYTQKIGLIAELNDQLERSIMAGGMQTYGKLRSSIYKVSYWRRGITLLWFRRLYLLHPGRASFGIVCSQDGSPYSKLFPTKSLGGKGGRKYCRTCQRFTKWRSLIKLPSPISPDGITIFYSRGNSYLLQKISKKPFIWYLLPGRRNIYPSQSGCIKWSFKLLVNPHLPFSRCFWALFLLFGIAGGFGGNRSLQSTKASQMSDFGNPWSLWSQHQYPGQRAYFKEWIMTEILVSSTGHSGMELDLFVACKDWNPESNVINQPWWEFS